MPPPLWYSEAWALEQAGFGVARFLRTYPVAVRLTRLDRDHWLWPAYARVARLAGRGTLPAEESHAKGRARLAAFRGCIDELRTLLGRPGSAKYRHQNRPLSLSVFGNPDYHELLPARLAVPDPTPPVELRDSCRAALARFPRKTRETLRLYFGLDGTPRTMAAVGDLLGVGESTISQRLSVAGVPSRG